VPISLPSRYRQRTVSFQKVMRIRLRDATARVIITRRSNKLGVLVLHRRALRPAPNKEGVRWLHSAPGQLSRTRLTVSQRYIYGSAGYGGVPMASNANRWSSGISMPSGFSQGMQAVGALVAMSADAVRFLFRRPFQAREFLEQSWFIARVSLAPTILVAIPFTVLVSFILNILLRELGAADLSGAGAAFGAVTQVGPLVTVLIVAGAGATAMCADLGSRTIREEIDAMEVLGINPVQRLVAPRMLASGLVALLLNSLVVIIGILGGYAFSVFVQDVNPGAFAAGITLLTGIPEVIISCVKAALFGLIAGLVACYRGLTITTGGAKAVGNAVNETVVYAFMALFVINVVVTAIGIRFSTK
jgi:phospholipid/cholesterol/gamma-HCH transport system permease protein